MRLRPRFLCLLGVILLTGCGPKLYHEVSGTVLVDNQPLDQGDILFVSEDGTLGSDAGKIAAGQFRFQSTAGKKKVQIISTRELPRPAGSPGEPVLVNVLPPRYNVQTTLTAEVRAEGDNQYEFRLESK
jgi:hypothetical protein